MPQVPGATPTDRIITLTSCNPVYTASERIVVYGVYDTWFPRAGGAPDAALLDQDEEKALYAGLVKLTGDISPILAEERYGDAMKLLAGMRVPVDAYFDSVTVNCDEPAVRVNRLRTLSRIRAAMNQVADFSQIEGGER